MPMKLVLLHFFSLIALVSAYGSFGSYLPPNKFHVPECGRFCDPPYHHNDREAIDAFNACCREYIHGQEWVGCREDPKKPKEQKQFAFCWGERQKTKEERKATKQSN